MSSTSPTSRHGAGTPPIVQSGAHVWESLPGTSNADAKYEHSIHGTPNPRSISGSPRALKSASLSPNRVQSPTSPLNARRSLVNLEPLGDQPSLFQRARASSLVSPDRSTAVRAVEIAVAKALGRGQHIRKSSNVPDSVSPESEADTGASAVAFEPSPYAGPVQMEVPVFAPPRPETVPVVVDPGPDWYQTSSEVASVGGDEAASVYHIGTPNLAPSSAQPSGGSLDETPFSRSAPVDAIPEEDLGDITAASASPGRRNPSSQVLKLIVLGDASVGKTALIQRFVNGTFQALPYKPTVGADFYSQKLEYTSKKSGERTMITLQIWDTAGQERYKSLATSFYRGADLCVIVEDASRPATLASVAQWHSDFLAHASVGDAKSFPFVFLLNKADLLTDADAAEQEQLWKRQVSERFKIPESRAFIASAKSGDNVAEAFFLATKLAAQKAITAGGRQAGHQSSHLINLNARSESDEEDSCLSQC